MKRCHSVLVLLATLITAACGPRTPVPPGALPTSSLPQPQAGTPAEPPQPPLSPEQEAVPPIYFFYAIHTHASGDYLPYTEPPMLTIDPQTAENMVLTISSMQEVLDRYQIRGTWEVVYGTAKGICTYQGENHIFQQLQDAGHEIAAHAHQTDHIDDVVQNLMNDCGVTPVTTSGFLLEAERAGPAGAQEALSLAIQVSLDNGLTVGTENLAPSGGKNPFTEICQAQLGIGNDMWLQTGNLMFPWRPDYANGNICAHNPEGEMVFIDHVSIEWTVLPDQGKADVLGLAEFTNLRTMFDAALAYMEQNRPQRLAVWGFVTHITEYAPGSFGRNPPDPSALAALDDFLAYVDSKHDQGRIIYATASQIAHLAFPDQ